MTFTIHLSDIGKNRRRDPCYAPLSTLPSTRRCTCRPTSFFEN